MPTSESNRSRYRGYDPGRGQRHERHMEEEGGRRGQRGAADAYFV